MEYTVTLKLWLPNGGSRWATRVVVEAPNEADALFEAEMRIHDDKEFEGYKIVDYRISEYERNDEYRFIEDVTRWELEENAKAAPAEIARALNRIADKMGYSSPAPQPPPQPIVQDSGIKPYMVVSVICSIAAATISILSLLINLL